MSRPSLVSLSLMAALAASGCKLATALQAAAGDDALAAAARPAAGLEDGRSPGPSGALVGQDDRVPLKWIQRAGSYGPGEYGRRLRLQDRNRYYELHVPASYRPGTPMPLVMVLHGGGGNAANARATTKMSEVADKGGFMVLYPAGTHALFDDRLLHWNSGPAPKNARQRAVDDVAYLKAALDDVAASFAVDPKRVYATGFSNGAQMCFRLATDLYDRLAAVGPVAGTRMPGDYVAAPSGPMPVMMVNGTADPYIKYEGGGPPPGTSFEENEVPAAPEAALAWARHNGCALAAPEVTTRGKARREDFDCVPKGETALWTLDGAGHTWPGGRVSEFEREDSVLGVPITPVGPMNTDIKASEELWAFFKRHSLDERKDPSPAASARPAAPQVPVEDPAVKPVDPAATAALASEATRKGPYAPAQAYQVETHTGLVARDPAGKRDLPLLVRRPKASGSFPVVIYSHGLGGSANGAAFLSTYMASLGYVVIHPVHVGTDLASVCGDLGFATLRCQLKLTAAVKDETNILNRPRDIRAVVDALAQIGGSLPAGGAQPDKSKIALVGHSLGAFTTLASAGARVAVPGKGAQDLGVPGIMAFLAMSPPAPGPTKLFHDDAFGGLTKPVLVMSGSEDKVSIDPDTTGEMRMRSVDLMPAGDKYGAWLEGANHLTFSGSDPKTVDMQPAIQYVTAAFLDGYVRGQENARRALKLDTIKLLSGGKMSVRAR